MTVCWKNLYQQKFNSKTKTNITKKTKKQSTGHVRLPPCNAAAIGSLRNAGRLLGLSVDRKLERDI